MGNSRWDTVNYQNYSQTVSNKTQQQIFTNVSGCDPDLNPAKFSFRESCDSPKNPESTPIIIGADETGSMGHLATQIIKEGLGIVMDNIVDKKPVTDPHVLLMALGDAFCDSAPCQATQFEADTTIVTQIEKFYLEGNGGGNGGESYLLAWWFAMNKVKCDSMLKRNRKGYLFTVGDEACHTVLTREQIQRIMGVTVERDVSAKELLEACQACWNVFHIITPTGATGYQHAVDKWRELLQERAIVLDDWTKMSEIIVSTMQINEGHDRDGVLNSWDEGTRVIVSNALKALPSGSNPLATTNVEEI